MQAIVDEGGDAIIQSPLEKHNPLQPDFHEEDATTDYGTLAMHRDPL
ncbi:hypothetical protein PR001_g33759 [Phytophthora rubi]|uniref:Uncharacterized protein n=1 Tax=Phytophthora rubi TaxID=129364 RepID=A0A6A3FYU7_9STRA|nr:hypothetical protein PR001_g33759 [Phytophthora rubi]